MISKSIVVRRPLQTAFDAFTRQIGKWWPLRQGFSFGRERAGEIFMEQHVGGRFFERLIDGEEILIGLVTGYAPPSRVVFTWKAPGWSRSTEVEVRFSTVDSGTRVELEHRGLERAAAEQEKSYSGGWDLILERYAGATAI